MILPDELELENVNFSEAVSKISVFYALSYMDERKKSAVLITKFRNMFLFTLSP